MALTKTKKMPNGTAANYDVTRQSDCKTSHHGTAELFTSSGQGLLIFDPLGNGSPVLHIDNQKVSQLKESQEVEMKWGLGRSVSLHISM